MKKITLFYHYWIPDDMRAPYWHYILDDQLRKIRDSNLHKVAKINLNIVMPMYWTHDNIGIPYRSNQAHEEILFYEKVKEYINYFYPWANLTFFDTGSKHKFEGHTLLPLWEYSKNNPNEIVIYVHGKGIFSVRPQVKLWRELLDQEFITNWTTRINDIDGYEVLGIKDNTILFHNDHPSHVSGNFFWATTDYVSTLVEPDFNSDRPWEDSFWPPTPSNERYWYEQWIVSKNPKVNYFLNTDNNHYLDYYT